MQLTSRSTEPACWAARNPGRVRPSADRAPACRKSRRVRASLGDAECPVSKRIMRCNLANAARERGQVTRRAYRFVRQGSTKKRIGRPDNGTPSVSPSRGIWTNCLETTTIRRGGVTNPHPRRKSREEHGAASRVRFGDIVHESGSAERCHIGHRSPARSRGRGREVSVIAPQRRKRLARVDHEVGTDRASQRCRPGTDSAAGTRAGIGPGAGAGNSTDCHSAASHGGIRTCSNLLRAPSLGVPPNARRIGREHSALASKRDWAARFRLGRGHAGDRGALPIEGGGLRVGQLFASSFSRSGRTSTPKLIRRIVN